MDRVVVIMAFYRPWISKFNGITKNDKSVEVYELLSRFDGSRDAATIKEIYILKPEDFIWGE